jgi:hypothetical protein
MGQRQDSIRDKSLSEFLAEKLDSDAETIRREAGAVDLPPPWEGEIEEIAADE